MWSFVWPYGRSAAAWGLGEGLHDGASAWSRQHSHYLGGVLIGFQGSSSSGLKMTRTKPFSFLPLFERERQPQKKSKVSCLPDKHWFWQTGRSQLFLACLVGAVPHKERKDAYEGIACAVCSDRRRGRDNNRGRKVLITEKHQGHDLMLLETVFGLRRRLSVCQICFVAPPSRSLLYFCLPTQWVSRH